MIRSIGRASRRRAVLCSLGVICIILAGCSQTFRQIAIPLPTQTGDPAPLNRALFASTDASGKPGSVTFVDVPGDTNVGVVQVGEDPVHIGLTFGGGRAVTSNLVENTASSFQTGTTTPTVSTTSLPGGANPVFAHSRQNGKFYLALSGLGELGVVDSTLSLVKQVPLTSCTPVAISQVPNGGNVYVGCSGGNVSVVTPSDNVEVDTISAGIPIAWMDTSTDGKYTFVGGGSSVKVICSTTDVSVCAGDSILQTITVGGTISFLKYDTHSQRVYVAGSGFVSIIDASGIQPPAPNPTTFTVTTIGGFGGNTWVTALQDGTRFYVSASGAKTVSVYTASNLAFIKAIPLAITAEMGTSPIMIDSDKNSTKVYTANTGSNDFSIIRTSDDTEVFPGSVAASGRLLTPKLVSCSDAVMASCRQTPTYVQVLP
jgi:hypothetical protein